MITRRQRIKSKRLSRTIIGLWILTLVMLLYYKQLIHQPTFISPVEADYTPSQVVTTPTIQPSPTPETAHDPEWVDIAKEIIDVFKPEGKQVTEWALRCFYSESGWRNEAYNFNKNGSDDRGVAQVNSIHNFMGNLHDYKYNIRKAHEIYKRQGKNAWYGKQCD